MSQKLMTSALHKLYPDGFQLQQILGMVGAHWVLQAIAEGRDLKEISAQLRDPLEKFAALRNKYLLY